MTELPPLPQVSRLRLHSSPDQFSPDELLPTGRYLLGQDSDLRRQSRFLEKWKLKAEYSPSHFLMLEVGQSKPAGKGGMSILPSKGPRGPAIHSHVLDQMFHPKFLRPVSKHHPKKPVGKENLSNSTPLLAAHERGVKPGIDKPIEQIKVVSTVLPRFTSDASITLSSYYNEELVRQIVRKNILRNKSKKNTSDLQIALDSSSKIISNFSQLSSSIRPRAINYAQLLKEIEIHPVEKHEPSPKPPKIRNAMAQNSELEDNIRKIKTRLLEIRKNIAATYYQLDLYDRQISSLQMQIRITREQISEECLNLHNVESKVLRRPFENPLANKMKSLELQLKSTKDKQAELRTTLKLFEDNFQKETFKRKVSKIQIIENLFEELQELDPSELTKQNLHHQVL